MKVITKLKHNNNARKMENNSNKIIYQKSTLHFECYKTQTDNQSVFFPYLLLLRINTITHRGTNNKTKKKIQLMKLGTPNTIIQFYQFSRLLIHLSVYVKLTRFHVVNLNNKRPFKQTSQKVSQCDYVLFLGDLR